MRKIFLMLGLALSACQSVQDPESKAALGLMPPGYTADTLPSPADLSQLSSRCEAAVIELYKQRAMVPPLRQRDFSLAIGQASAACTALQQAMEVLRKTAKTKEDYQHNMAFAKECIGAGGGADSFSPDTFPEATEAIEGPAIIPPSSVKAEPLDPTPLGSSVF